MKEPKKLEIIKGANHTWKDIDFKHHVLEFQERAMELTVDWFNKWLK